MSHQKILNTLESLGFSSLDAEVYVFLGKKGAKKASEIVQSLHIPKQQLYTILKNLQSKGIINASFEHPARFSAEPFEKVLDLFLKAKVDEVHQIQGNKTQILTDWQSIRINEVKDKPATFKVLEGDNYIYPKLKQMLEEAKNQLLVVFTLPELIRINQNETLGDLFLKSSRSSIKLKILTEILPENQKIMNSIFHKKFRNIEIRTPDFGLKLPNSMLISDEEEVAFIIDSNQNGDFTKTNTCLWTNCRALVQSFNSVFKESWQNATDFQKKITEMKTGQLPHKITVIRDAEQAQKKFEEKLNSTQKSIYIITSPNGLIEIWKDQNQSQSWIKKGIHTRIMAPITQENLQATKQLMKFCEVKHIEEGFITATIIDKQHLFQFKLHPQKGNSANESYFENTFYTDDNEYIEKMENMLEVIWENAQYPILLTPEEPLKDKSKVIFDGYRTEFNKILDINYQKEPQEGKISEKDILEKIAGAIRIPAKDPKKDVVRIYNTMGTVVIYPDKKLKLPNLLFQVAHAGKNSSFGESNTLTISIQTSIADEQSYLQTVFITDSPEGYEFRKKMLKDQYNTEAVYLLNKDELTIQASAHNLFAGWTVPIPLLCQKYILPPANLIFKSSGKTRTYSAELKSLMRRRLTYEFNCLDAFVTFMLPSSRYHSPATDGLFYRECIITSYPPST